MSMVKVNGSDGFSAMFSVLTKPQLLRDAARPFLLMMSEPIAQRPRPGGRNFMVNIRSYISWALAWACSGFQPSLRDSMWFFWSE